jgi:nucleotide-binding universal stress UspA family protein
MYKTIIVPLDGLPFAAQAVATAAEIGKRCGADLILARVHEAYIYEDMDYALTEDNSRRDEEEYLADVAEWIESRYGIVPQRRLLSGPVVPALCAFAGQLDEPLIVISSHGRTRLSRLWLGSIADGVTRHVVAPVLMLRHHGADEGLATPPHPFASIMMPLDGSDLSESVLPHVAALAEAFESRLLIARVVALVKTPAAAYAVPFAIPRGPLEETLDARVDGAQSYLNAIAARLRSANRMLDVSTSVHVADSAAPALLDAAKEASADTIALATHGRGSSRLIVPSILDRIVRDGPEAILIVHAPASA